MTNEKIKKIQHKEAISKEAVKILLELKKTLKTNKAISEKTGINISQIEQALSGRILLPEKHFEKIKQLITLK